jgi:hypothetical protein
MSVKKLGIVGLFGLLGATMGLTACGDEAGSNQGSQTSDDNMVRPNDPTTRGYLASPRTFDLMTGGIADVTAMRTYDGDITETTSLSIRGGSLTVHTVADGRVLIDELKIDLGNYHLSATSVPPDGLDLMNVQVSLTNTMPSETRWTADGYASVITGKVSLMLDWSLLSATTGQLVPLATQRIDDVPLELDIVPQHDGTLRASVHASRDGVFWGWTGLLELADLRLDVQAMKN